ncbi:MAG: hypothetical protein WCW33_00415 [Candidatus Babeliales bacterium]|jgi:hypothetical protein
MIIKAMNGMRIAQGVLLAAVCMLGLNAYPEFKKIDQPFVFFKAADGFKFPYMMVCNPGLNQWNMVLCGTVKNGKTRLAKSAEDLENLVPLRNTIKFADNGSQIDKKYPGYRDANLAIMLEVFFRAVGLIPQDGYAGTVLFDEYKAGLPIKAVFGSIEYFRAWRNYMIKHLATADSSIFPLKKPLLMMEFLDGKATFNEDDLRFLRSCFVILDPTDASACAFFECAQSKLNDVMDMTDEARFVKESVGEMFMRKIEDFSSLEAKKVTLALSAAVAFYFLIAPVTDIIKDWGAKYGPVGGLKSLFKDKIPAAAKS